MHTIDQKIYAQFKYEMVFCHTRPLYVTNIAILFYRTNYPRVSSTIYLIEAEPTKCKNSTTKGICVVFSS